MGRTPCCDKANVKKGPWSPEEDSKLKGYIEKYGTGGNWIALPRKVGLRRCGKSCRLRWLNYLRPNIKHGEFSDEEDTIILTLFATIGSRWSIIATQLPGRTDNDIKNYWNTKLKKKLMGTMIPNPKKIIKSSLSSQAFPPPNIYHQSSPLSLLSQSLPSSLLYGDNLFYPSSTNCTSTIHDPIANSSLFTGGLNVSSSVIPPISLLPDNNYITNPSSMLQPHEGNVENPVELPYSCSSTIIKQERTDHLQGFISDGSEESHQTQWEEKGNEGCYGESNYNNIGSSAVDFELEEMRRLIGSSSGGSGNSSFLSSLY